MHRSTDVGLAALFQKDLLGCYPWGYLGVALGTGGPDSRAGAENNQEAFSG